MAEDNKVAVKFTAHATDSYTQVSHYAGEEKELDPDTAQRMVSAGVAEFAEGSEEVSAADAASE